MPNEENKTHFFMHMACWMERGSTQITLALFARMKSSVSKETADGWMDRFGKLLNLDI